MFNASSIIVGLEIGTSKVCAVVGELGVDGTLNIVGVGQSRSRGVRKGEIADAPLAEEDVRHAIVEAAQVAARHAEVNTPDLDIGHLLRFDDGVAHVLFGQRRVGDFAFANAAGARLAEADDI